MIDNMVVVGNGKGGVLKSSIVSNLGGMAAASGWRVLVIDTDPQGHIALDLGVEADQNDHGESLYKALIEGGDLRVVQDVRPSLDLVSGGEAAARVIGGLQQLMASGELDLAMRSFEKAVAPLASNYNLILVDTPPGEKVLQKVILAASHFIVVPTKVDRGSRQGIDRVCRDLLDVETFNPHLEMLGVVAVGLGRRSVAMQRDARARLEAELGGLAPVMTTMIHDVGKAAVDCREVGLLAMEYEHGAKLSEEAMSVAERIAARKAGQTKDFSSGASGLAEDYQRLSDEVLSRFGTALLGEDVR